MFSPQAKKRLCSRTATAFYVTTLALYQDENTTLKIDIENQENPPGIVRETVTASLLSA
jgi:hypothetical protein